MLHVFYGSLTLICKKCTSESNDGILLHLFWNIMQIHILWSSIYSSSEFHILTPKRIYSLKIPLCIRMAVLRSMVLVNQHWLHEIVSVTYVEKLQSNNLKF